MLLEKCITTSTLLSSVTEIAKDQAIPFNCQNLLGDCYNLFVPDYLNDA